MQNIPCGKKGVGVKQADVKFEAGFKDEYSELKPERVN